MNPVYNEMIQFLSDKGIEIGLKEGYYWIDRMFIKCFDKQGNIQKIARILIDNKLNVTYKVYEHKKPFEIESWEQTIKRNTSRLQQLEEESISLIRENITRYEGYTHAVLSSGGKDSSVTTYLVSKVIDNPLIIFSNTSLDSADTYMHIKKEENLKIINPDEGFYQWQKRINMVPTRMGRACCTEFKEGAMIKKLEKDKKYLFFLGMRNEESNTRSNYGDEWRNEKWGKREWYGVLPIRKWSEIDIWLYIMWKNISINPKYRKGYARVGCAIACPFYSKSTWVLDKYWYPSMYNRWHEILEKDFIENKKAPILNCTLQEYHYCWNGSAIREEPTEEVREEFSRLSGLSREISDKYFVRECSDCGGKLKKFDVPLSLKLYGRNIERYKCTKCLMSDFDITANQVREMYKDFKKQGCSLF